MLRVTDELSERIDGASSRAEAAERRVRELEERLLRLERRGTAPPSDGRVAARARMRVPDYFAYETRMRAPTEEIRERQRPYVDLLRAHTPVLDVGCGRGELLSLLREADIDARGVDANADMVAFAQGEGLDVAHADLFDALADASSSRRRDRATGRRASATGRTRPLLRARARGAARRAGCCRRDDQPASPAALRHYFADLTHASRSCRRPGAARAAGGLRAHARSGV